MTRLLLALLLLLEACPPLSRGAGVNAVDHHLLAAKSAQNTKARDDSHGHGVSASAPLSLRDPDARASRSRTLTAGRFRQTVNPSNTTGSSHIGTGSLLDWDALFACESGNNPRAVSPGGRYRGLAQFDLKTWRSVGGTGDPARASRRDQLLRAELLYAERGREPWPICGRLLVEVAR